MNSLRATTMKTSGRPLPLSAADGYGRAEALPSNRNNLEGCASALPQFLPSIVTNLMDSLQATTMKTLGRPLPLSAADGYGRAEALPSNRNNLDDPV
jgi:hypothetical protein